MGAEQPPMESLRRASLLSGSVGAGRGACRCSLPGGFSCSSLGWLSQHILLVSRSHSLALKEVGKGPKTIASTSTSRRRCFACALPSGWSGNAVLHPVPLFEDASGFWSTHLKFHPLDALLWAQQLWRLPGRLFALFRFCSRIV